MTPKKVYFVMLGVCVISSIAVVGALVGSVSVLKSYSNKLVAVKLENRVLDEQQASLTSARKAIQTYQDLNNIAKAVVPQDKDQAKTVRSISSVASELGIRLSAISFPPSTLGQSSKSQTAKAKVTQLSPVSGLAGVYKMQITVQSDTSTPITYQAFLDFLSKLETNRRTAQVSNITILPDSSDRTKLTFNLVLDTYVKP